MKQPTHLPLLAAALVLLATLPLCAQDTAGAPSATERSDTLPISNLKSEISAASTPGIIEGRIYSKLQDKTLLNARVRVKGTFREAFTDEFGFYRLVDVPPGDIELEVFYTGMAVLEATITLSPGARVTRDFELVPYSLRSDAHAPTGPTVSKDDDILILEQFSVNARRETSLAAIATNEQRFSVANKSVVEVDAFGEQTTDNIGDFLKFMPGVAVDYDGADPKSVSIRGFGSAFISVSADGARQASANMNELEDDVLESTRAFSFEQSSINNISRIEVKKMPTPSDSADMIGGSINIISKSAFERRTAQLKYRILYNLNSEDIEFLRKTPGPLYNYTYKALPGFDFDWTCPVTKNFGIVVTGKIGSRTGERHISETQWNFYREIPDDPTYINPYLQKYTYTTTPSIRDSQSAMLRADWRLARNHVFSLSYTVTRTINTTGKRSMSWDTDYVANNSKNSDGTYAYHQWGYTPTLGYYAESAEATVDTKKTNETILSMPNGAFVRPIVSSPDASITQNVGCYTKNGLSNAFNFKYNYKGNRWAIDAGLNGSFSRTWRRDGDNGYFSAVKTKIKSYIGRLGFYDIDPSGNNAPGSIIAYAGRSDEEIAMGYTHGEELDVFDVKNYTINTVELNTYDVNDSYKNATLNIQRTLGNLPFLASVKTGADIRQQIRENSINRYRMTMLSAITNDYDPMMREKEASVYIDQAYSKVSPAFGLPSVTWISPKAVYDKWLQNQNNDWFQAEKNQARDSARDTYRGDNKITENITSFYLQLDARLLDNRLALCTGVRWEMTDDRGLGCYEPTEGVSAEDVYANWIRRGAISHRTYNDLYPSFHVNYNITENLLARFSWATSLARPDFESILPNIRIKDADTIYESEITINNTGLRPYKAQNYDISIEYYLPNGGYVGGSVFYKRISNFFGKARIVATIDKLNELELSTDYIDYVIVSKFNLDTMTTVYGAEFFFRLPLDILGDWGRAFNLWGNASAMNIKTHELADLGGFIKSMANTGIQYNARRFTLGLSVNYRGRQKKEAKTDDKYYQRDSESAYDHVPFAGFYNWQVPQFTVDANLEYNFSKRISFVATARNIANRPIKYEVYNSTSAASAPQSKPFRVEYSGASITMALKGTF